MGVTSRIRSRRTKDRGAVLVEAALAIPFLILLIFGAIETGMAWEARSSTTSGVRTGLLRAAQLGDKPETDLRILQSVVGEIGADKVGNIEYIVIFDATDPDHAGTIANCAGAIAGGGLSTTCNTYTNAQLNQVVNGTLTITDFDNGAGGEPESYVCDSSGVDSNWCPGSRLGAGNAINVGVAVKYDHSWFTGILPGDGVEFTEFAISSTLVGDQAAPLYTVPPPPPPPTTAPPPTTTAAPTTTTTAAPTTTTTAAPTTTTAAPAPDSYSPESMVLNGEIESDDEDGYDYAEIEEDDSYNEPGDSSIDMTYTVVEDGTFYLTALVWHWHDNPGSRDSFWVVIDGDTDGAMAWHIGNSGHDGWANSTNSPSFDLSAGSYTISLYAREEDSRIATDTIQLNAA